MLFQQTAVFDFVLVPVILVLFALQLLFGLRQQAELPLPCVPSQQLLFLHSNIL